MSMTVTMNEAGFLELPEVVRRHFKMKGAARLELEMDNDTITLRPAPAPVGDDVPEARVEMRNGRKVIVGAPPVTSEQIIQAIAADREERTDRIVRACRES